MAYTFGLHTWQRTTKTLTESKKEITVDGNICRGKGKLAKEMVAK
jgi:hypothetical protein